MKIFVGTSSKHGATHEIRERIAKTLRAVSDDTEVTSLDLGELVDGGHQLDLTEYDGIILGSAVYYGHWLDSAHRFIDTHADDLRACDVWLFSSGPLTPGVADAAPDDLVQAEQLKAQIGPIECVLFNGFLDRHRLNFGERALTFAMQAPDGDFRNWADIEAWAKRIGEHLSQHGRSVTINRIVETVSTVPTGSTVPGG
jgi:menaquinone-dependent protoporphyrinogen oxidase